MTSRTPAQTRAAEPAPHPPERSSLAHLLRTLLLTLSCLLLALRFFHLLADFPNGSPWMDWAKYTDEGWYGDAAIRYYLQGHWYVPGDFNPGVAMPVWPLLEAVLFRFTGVSLAAARALTVVTFATAVACLYWLMERFPGRSRLAAPIAVFLLAASPFTYVFSRMAILEPPLVMLTLLSLSVASTLRPWKPGDPLRRLLAPRSLLLGCLFAAMMLTKTTALTLMPGLLYMLWCRAGRRFAPTCRLAGIPAAVGVLLWGAYLALFVRPRFQEDYNYLFSANRYTTFQTDPLANVLAGTASHAAWIGLTLCITFAVAGILLALLRPAFFRDPLVGSLVLMIAGYASFLAYHNYFQPRYYFALVIPVTAVTVLALGALFPWPSASAREGNRSGVSWQLGVQAAVVLAIAVPDLLQQIPYVLHPEYSFVTAAQAVGRTIRGQPNHSQLLLSISGSDISLITGLPSINDDFGTLDLDERVRKYRPGWFLAWNNLEDDKMEALTPDFRPVRVATFPAMDDPERNQMVLYRLDDAGVDGQK